MDLFFDAVSLIPFGPKSLDERPLGGTETAVIRVATELALLGHTVLVRTAHADYESLGDVEEENLRYVPRTEQVDITEYDAVIVVQNWMLLPFYLDRKKNNTKCIFWTGDGAEQFSNVGIGDKRVAGAVDAMCVVSTFHKQSLCTASRFPEEKCHIVSNGVADVFLKLDDTSADDSAESGKKSIKKTSKKESKKSAKKKTKKTKKAKSIRVKRNPDRLIYHSAPYRGLHHLLRYLDTIRQSVDKVHIEIFSDMDLYSREGEYRGRHQDVVSRLKARYENTDGIHFNQTLPQNKLPPHLREASLFPYPCLVPEVFCMSMLEAMACGVVPLVRSIGALPEILSDDDLIIEGEPGTEIFDKPFIERCTGLLLDRTLLKKKSNAMKRKAKKYTWKNSAEQLLSVIERIQ